MRRVAKTAPPTDANIGGATPLIPAKTMHAASATTAPHRPKSRRGKRRTAAPKRH